MFLYFNVETFEKLDLENHSRSDIVVLLILLKIYRSNTTVQYFHISIFTNILYFQPQPPMYHQQIYPVPQQQVFIPGIPYNTGNRQPNFVQTLPVYTGAPFQYSFNAPQNTPPTPLQCKYFSFPPNTTKSIGLITALSNRESTINRKYNRAWLSAIL